MTMSFAAVDERSQLLRAVRRQSQMGRKQRIAVSLRSGPQWFGERRRLDGMIDTSNPAEVAVRTMGQGNRDAIRSRPTMMEE